MNIGLFFAITTALIMGLWTVFQQQSSHHINNLFGAVIISSTAVLLGLFFLLPKIKSITLYTNPKGIVFAMLAGIMAFGLDYFALRTYGSGLPVSIGGPIIIGGGIAVATFFGFFLGESLTLIKIIGILLVIAGSVLLAMTSK